MGWTPAQWRALADEDKIEAFAYGRMRRQALSDLRALLVEKEMQTPEVAALLALDDL